MAAGTCLYLTCLIMISTFAVYVTAFLKVCATITADRVGPLLCSPTCSTSG